MPIYEGTSDDQVNSQSKVLKTNFGKDSPWEAVLCHTDHPPIIAKKIYLYLSENHLEVLKDDIAVFASLRQRKCPMDHENNFTPVPYIKKILWTAMLMAQGMGTQKILLCWEPG